MTRARSTGAGGASAAGDRGDHANLLRAFKPCVEAVALAQVFAVHVDVHERAERAALVEEQVRDRKRVQRLRDRGRVGLEPGAAARLCRQERRQQDYGQSATSTERIGGRFRAVSVHVPPSPAPRTQTEPPCVPM